MGATKASGPIGPTSSEARNSAPASMVASAPNHGVPRQVTSQPSIAREGSGRQGADPCNACREPETQRAAWRSARSAATSRAHALPLRTPCSFRAHCLTRTPLELVPIPCARRPSRSLGIVARGNPSGTGVRRARRSPVECCRRTGWNGGGLSTDPRLPGYVQETPCDFRHQPLRRHSQGVFGAQRLFGTAVRNSEGSNAAATDNVRKSLAQLVGVTGFELRLLRPESSRSCDNGRHCLGAVNSLCTACDFFHERAIRETTGHARGTCEAKLLFAAGEKNLECGTAAGKSGMLASGSADRVG